MILFTFSALIVGAVFTLRTWRNDPRLRRLESETFATLLPSHRRLRRLHPLPFHVVTD